MRHLDLFSGIGGFALAAQWVWGEEYENVGFCDNNKFCQQVLKKNFKHAIIYDDIRKLNGSEIKNLDLLTGGFPCQPFSFAGKRRSKDDDRYLWPEMLRVIREARPRWIIGENVAGIINLALDQVLSDLEAEGYTIQAFVIPACAIGAPHKRDRVWIVGHDDTDASGQRAHGRGIHEDDQLQRRGVLSAVQAKRGKTRGKVRADITSPSRNPADPEGAGQQSWAYGSGKVQFWGSDTGYDWLAVATSLCRVDDGLPAQLDGRELTPKQHRIERIKALGNAIVPWVVVEVMKEIKAIGGAHSVAGF
jgi:DNA (cytosine-5)-methyltransferase 1